MSDQPSPNARGLVFTIHKLGGADVIESASAAHPFILRPGERTILPYIEERMATSPDYERRRFVIPCAHAFGPYEDASAWFARSEFDPAAVLTLGMPLLAEKADGSVQPMVVLELEPTRVHCSLNHWLAGCDLLFIGHCVPLPSEAPALTPPLFSNRPFHTKLRS